MVASKSCADVCLRSSGAYTAFRFHRSRVVLTARSSHLELFASPGRLDQEIAEEALRLPEHPPSVRHARYTELSGGERQLVLIARALAQQAQGFCNG